MNKIVFPSIDSANIESTKLLDQMKTIIKEVKPFLPIVTVGIPSYATKGVIEILVAGYDGSQYKENPIKQLGPGETFGCSSNILKNVPDFNPNIGTFLLVRVISPGNQGPGNAVEVDIVNLNNQELNIRTGYPPVFPWWGGKMTVESGWTVWIPFIKFLTKDRQIVLWFTHKMTP